MCVCGNVCVCCCGGSTVKGQFSTLLVLHLNLSLLLWRLQPVMQHQQSLLHLPLTDPLDLSRSAAAAAAAVI
jgi:hypothetical protein